MNDFWGDLRANERIVLAYKYGLNCLDELSQRQIAALLGFSHQHVSQLERGALKKLRLHFKSKGLSLSDFV